MGYTLFFERGATMGKEIKCPKCGSVFQVDETGYAQIVQQVRDTEFEKELKHRAGVLRKIAPCN